MSQRKHKLSPVASLFTMITDLLSALPGAPFLTKGAYTTLKMPVDWHFAQALYREVTGSYWDDRLCAEHTTPEKMTSSIEHMLNVVVERAPMTDEFAFLAVSSHLTTIGQQLAHSSWLTKKGSAVLVLKLAEALGRHIAELRKHNMLSQDSEGVLGLVQKSA